MTLTIQAILSRSDAFPGHARPALFRENDMTLARPHPYPLPREREKRRPTSGIFIAGVDSSFHEDSFGRRFRAPRDTHVSVTFSSARIVSSLSWGFLGERVRVWVRVRASQTEFANASPVDS